MDARAASAVADLQRASDALTFSRARYLGRLVEPRWAVVPALLAQLADAIVRGKEMGAVTTSNPFRVPLDLDAEDLMLRIRREVRAARTVAGLQPRPHMAGDVRQLAAHGRTLAATNYPALVILVEQVTRWRDAISELLPETRTSRDLPDLTCQRCKRRRVVQLDDGRRLLVPAMRYVATPMPGVVCRSCGHLYQGDSALRGLAAWQRSA